MFDILQMEGLKSGAKKNWSCGHHTLPSYSDDIQWYYAAPENSPQLYHNYNPKSEKVGTVWKTQIKKESSDF